MAMEIILGQSLALVTAFCWAQNSVIYSHVGAKISSATTAHIRLWISLPLIILVHFAFNGTLFPQGIGFRELSLLGLSGAAGFFIADMFIFSAFVSLGARFTMVIMTLNPIFAALFAWFFNDESLTAVQLSGMAVTLSGVAWVVFSEGKRSGGSRSRHRVRGVIAACLGALSQAAAVVLAKNGMSEGIDPVGANLIRLGAGFLAIVIFRLFKGSFIKDMRHLIRPEKASLTILIFFAALVGPVIGMIANLKALTLAPVGVVLTLSQLTPVILIPYERFVLREHIAPGAVGGTLLAVLGTVLLFLF